MQRKKPNSIFPNFPRSSPFVDKNGNLTEIWKLNLGSLFQALNSNFKNEGIVFPNLDDLSIVTIESLYDLYIGGTYNNLVNNLPDISGQTVFDTTNRVSRQFVIATTTFPPTDTSTVILAEWVPLSVCLTGIGNPNGVQAGLVGWQYYDTVGFVLYACKLAGNTVTAQWAVV